MKVVFLAVPFIVFFFAAFYFASVLPSAWWSFPASFLCAIFDFFFFIAAFGELMSRITNR